MPRPLAAQVYTPSGQAAAYPVPRELGQQEIARIVEQFADGARNAIAAGACSKLAWPSGRAVVT